jgi:hypothetical protein
MKPVMYIYTLTHSLFSLSSNQNDEMVSTDDLYLIRTGLYFRY